MELVEYFENNYEGWEIAEDGKYLYNLGIEEQDTVVVDVKNRYLFELPSDMNGNLLFYSRSESNYIISASGNIINIYKIIKNKKKNYKLIKQINAHDFDITCLLKTDKYLISCSNDETIKLWSLDNFEHIHTFNHDDDVLCVNYSYSYLVSGDFHGTVKLWNMDTFELINQIDIEEYVVSVAICDKYIAISSSKPELYITDYKFNILQKFYHQERYIYYLQFSKDNKYLYSCTADYIITYMTNDDGCKLLKNQKHKTFVTSHCLTTDDYKILYTDDKKLCCLYTPSFHDFIKTLFITKGLNNYFLPEELILLIIKYL